MPTPPSPIDPLTVTPAERPTDSILADPIPPATDTSGTEPSSPVVPTAAHPPGLAPATASDHPVTREFLPIETGKFAGAGLFDDPIASSGTGQLDAAPATDGVSFALSPTSPPAGPERSLSPGDRTVPGATTPDVDHHPNGRRTTGRGPVSALDPAVQSTAGSPARVPADPPPLHRQRDFVSLWAAQSVSQLGSHISLLALPLAAVTLDASPAQMGLLISAERLPFLLFGLLAGVWVDRRRRQGLLVWADYGRAVLLALVPLAALLGWLRIELLLGVAFLVGTLTLVFDVAYVAYLPAVVRREQLTGANGRLETSFAVAQASGPGIGGVLVGTLGAPLAIGLDALSFLLSGALLGRIRALEPHPAASGTTSVASIRRETAEGVREVWRDGRLRAIAACGMTTSVFGWGFLAIYVLFMSRELGFSAATIGLVLTMGGIGSALGASLAGPAIGRLGVGGTLIAAQVVNTLGSLTIPLAILIPGWAIPMLAASEIVQWGALTLFGVVQVSLRQAIVPARLQGRVTASMRTLTTGGAALGGLGGGWLGGLVGLGPALIILGLGMGLAVLWAAISPLRTLRAIPREG